MRALLRNRDFVLAWTGGLVSMLGGWALWIALPLHVYETTGSALMTSAVVATVLVPGVLLGSIAGVYVDRWNRKTTLVVANLLLTVATLPLLLATDESLLWVVFPLVFFSEVLEQFTGPAENAFLPRLVAEEDLVAANSLNSLNNNLARLGGPAIGGALYAVGGLSGVVIADAISFLVAAGLLASVRTSGAIEAVGDATDAAVRRWRRVWQEWRDGLAVVRSSRAVSVVFSVRAITSLGEGVFAVMFAVWVREVLEAGVPQLGVLQTSQAVGGLIGGLLVAFAGRRLVPERLYGVGLLLFGVFDLLLFNYPLLLDGVWIGSALMILVGIPGASVGTAQTTILQTHVADAYRGRVFGSLATSSALLMLAGTLLAGAVGDRLGAIALLNVQGSVYVVAGLLVLAALAPRAVRPVSEAATSDAAAAP
jgi:MFS family permease